MIPRVVFALFLTFPFDFLEMFSNLPGIGWLNWFFPVGECLVVFSAWLVAYGVYLIYSVVMRWVKLIGD